MAHVKYIDALQAPTSYEQLRWLEHVDSLVPAPGERDDATEHEREYGARGLHMPTRDSLNSQLDAMGVLRDGFRF